MDLEEETVDTIDYPYVKNFLYLETFIKRIEEIRKFHPQILYVKEMPELEHLGKLERFEKDKYTVLVENQNDSIKSIEIVDVFQEQEIIKANWNGKISLEKAFDINKYELNKSEDKTLMEKRCMLRTFAKPISRFRPTLMINLIKIYRPHYILDFCAGWGDRLLGALVYDSCIRYYCGIDPNKNLFNGYNKMIDTFIDSKKDKQKYNMVCDCAENCDIPDPPNKSRKYDMIMTSPPYFDLEVYEDNNKQSINKYKTLDEWYTNFLLKSTKNAVMKLDKYGHMIISINDNGKDKYVERYIADVTKMVELKFVDLIYVTNDKNNLKGCQPLLVWQKICNI